ncbi:MAG TPA: hypothetical protein VMU39_15935 [Solirubrobacteraceae bacterium]|nr:hypothetical protein [Solirubrobacteraceae bacterium]
MAAHGRPRVVHVLLQVGRVSFLIVALRGRALGEHFVTDLVWELLTGVLWVAGAIADAILEGDQAPRVGGPRRL